MSAPIEPMAWVCPRCDAVIAPWVAAHRCGTATGESGTATGESGTATVTAISNNGTAIGDRNAAVSSIAEGLGSKALDPNPPKSKSRLTRAKHEYTPEFEEWFAAYPIRKDKFAAFAAYRKARETVPQETLLRAARAYAAECDAAPQLSPKYAQGWLNDRRWEDEPAPPRLAPGIIPTPRRQSPEEIAAEIAALGAEVDA